MRNFGQDYFDELLERIRDITKEFFVTVQNKLHFAIHGQTVAELIVDRVDATKASMDLTNCKAD